MVFESNSSKPSSFIFLSSLERDVRSTPNFSARAFFDSVMAFVIGKFIKEDELSEPEANTFKVVSEACIGCAMCVKVIPELFEMKGAKAVTIASDQLHVYHDRIVHVNEKCPSRAIVYEQ